MYCVGGEIIKMMTYEEAKNVIGQCVGCKYLFDGECISENKCFDAKVKAIEALEKQIPKKPVVKYLYDKSGKIYDSEYHCSVCGRFICYTTEFDIYNTYPYCHCGQALDFDKE